MNHDESTASSSKMIDLKKQQRLAAWRLKQQQQQQQQVSLPPPPPQPVSAPMPSVKVSWSVAVAASKHRKKKRKLEVNRDSTIKNTAIPNKNLKRNAFDDDEDDDDINNNELPNQTRILDIEALPQPPIDSNEESNRPTTQQRKRNRWDTNVENTKNLVAQPNVDNMDTTALTGTGSNQDQDKNIANDNISNDDSLDQFMAQLHSVASDDAVAKIGNNIIHLSGSVQRSSSSIQPITSNQGTDGVESIMDRSKPSPNTFSVMSTQSSMTSTTTNIQIEGKPSSTTSVPIFNPNDWLSDVNPNTDNEEDADTDMEDEQRWELIKALKQEQLPTSSNTIVDETSELNVTAFESSAVSMNDDKLSFREQHSKLVHELAEAAKQVLNTQQKNVQDIGREFFIAEEDDGIVEEAIREYEAATQQQADSTFMLLNAVDQTLNKKKELTSHQNESGTVQYEPFQKNIYRVSKSVASLTPTEVTNRRAKLRIRVRGVQVPAPVLQFHEMGLPESILQYMIQHHQPPITTPYPIQAQCIPCILAGRDVIGIAKTGSGKTLAYVLPMLRHIIIQPPLGVSTTNKSSSAANNRGETGPIALILVPARELAFQIHSVCKPYAKLLGLK